jgi:segregation and condensation protein A
MASPMERRAALSSTLLAGLEMARGGAIRLRQETAFGPILVGRGRHDAPHDTLDEPDDVRPH